MSPSKKQAKDNKPKIKDWSKEPLTRNEADLITSRAAAKFKAEHGVSPHIVLASGRMNGKNNWYETLYAEMQAFFIAREGQRLAAAATVPQADYAGAYNQRIETEVRDSGIPDFPETEVSASKNFGKSVAAHEMPW